MITDIFSSARKLRTGWFWISSLVLVVSLGLAVEVSAQTLSPEKTYKLMPRGDLYKPYIADIQRITFSAQATRVLHNDIPDTGDNRAGLSAGARFGIVRIYPDEHPELGWQFSLEGGADFMFDAEHSEDVIGWDGQWGWLLTHAIEKGWSFKLAMNHQSSHLGDEYMQRTGFTRINYTRREVALGVSKQFNPNYRIYVEGAAGYDPGDPDLEEPGRFQGGFEIEYPKSLWKERLGWYAATDLSTMQERDWKLDASLQVGLFVTQEERTLRMGFELYHGRPPVGEFFQSTESYITFGFWYDL